MRLRHCESGEAVELVEGEVTYLGRGVLGVTDKRISRRQLQISLRGPALAVTVYVHRVRHHFITLFLPPPLVDAVWACHDREGVNPVYVRRAGKAGDGELLSRGEEAILRNGDVVTLLADLHPLVLELDGDGNTSGRANAPAIEGVDGAAPTTTGHRVVQTERVATSKKRKLPFEDAGDAEEKEPQQTRDERDRERLERAEREQKEEAEVDIAQAREVIAAAQREIEVARTERLITSLELSKINKGSDDEPASEPDRKKSRPAPSSSSSSSSASSSSSSSSSSTSVSRHDHGASRGLPSRGRGRGAGQRRGGTSHSREVPRRRAGSRHAARVAKERMGEYLELVEEAGIMDEGAGSEEEGEEVDPMEDPDRFDAAEWKKNADDNSDDEEHVRGVKCLIIVIATDLMVVMLINLAYVVAGERGLGLRRERGAARVPLRRAVLSTQRRSPSPLLPPSPR